LQEMRKLSTALVENRFLFIVPLGENATNRAAILAKKLRHKNIPVEICLFDKTMKAAIKYADKMNFEYLYVIGENELAQKKGQLKEMKTGKQEAVCFDNFVNDAEKMFLEFKKKAIK